MARQGLVLGLALLTSGCIQSGFPIDLGSLVQSHPTVADCTAQGRQLNTTTEQCELAPETTAAQKPRVREVRSPAPPASPAPSPNAGIAVEPGAAIDNTLKGETKLVNGLVRVVRARGYQCDAISAVKPYSTSNGFRLACDRSRNKYQIEPRNDGWSVSVN
jgi:hypothetical protein